MNEKRLMNYSEAADLLGFSIPTLYSKVCRKEIPHIRFTQRCVRFDRNELHDWIESKKVSANVTKNLEGI